MHPWSYSTSKAKAWRVHRADGHAQQDAPISAAHCRICRSVADCGAVDLLRTSVACNCSFISASRLLIHLVVAVPPVSHVACAARRGHHPDARLQLAVSSPIV